jgi:hypothetical protein
VKQARRKRRSRRISFPCSSVLDGVHGVVLIVVTMGSLGVAHRKVEKKRRGRGVAAQRWREGRLGLGFT